MKAKEIDSLIERPNLYHNVDGLEELGTGLVCLAFALLGWLQWHTPPESVWHGFPAALIYMSALCAIIHFGTKAIKNRVTYRRTGFVHYPPAYKRWFPMAIAGGVSAIVAAGLVLAARRHWDLSLAVSLFGLFLTAAYVRIARAVRWKWSIFGAMMAGVLIIAALPADLFDGLANHAIPAFIPPRVMGTYWLTLVVYGGLLVISGAISFFLYVRHTRPQDSAGGRP